MHIHNEYRYLYLYSYASNRCILVILAMPGVRLRMCLQKDPKKRPTMEEARQAFPAALELSCVYTVNIHIVQLCVFRCIHNI